MEKMYHVGFDDTHGARYAILPGDPGRVDKIAAFLENPRFLCQNREYTTWLGELEGEKVLVMSTGMGGPWGSPPTAAWCSARIPSTASTARSGCPWGRS